ncbi:hypothetical protein IFM89_037965 [Coptis chinensis]|uniref:Uncharacterized protein n=1 Tax=Coptis chinensis TaxID=261450 RepID=A0A835I6B1_9MAGN|nr:hypothetical protein IFM89_037965 [Coptis chinensis]
MENNMGKAVVLSTAKELSTADKIVYVERLSYATSAKELLPSEEGNTASKGDAEGVNEQSTTVNLSVEGVPENHTSDGMTGISYTEGAKVISAVAKSMYGYDQVGCRTEKSVEDVLGHQATCEMTDKARSETEGPLEESSVARGMQNMADNGDKVPAEAALLFSKVAGMPASLQHKEPPSILAPNFRANLEENYTRHSTKMTNLDGNIVDVPNPSGRGPGYRYFGAAKKFPGVRELFEKPPELRKRRSRHSVKMTDLDGNIVDIPNPSGRGPGYPYFGVAKKLPGVR